jgi:hypothetical protein
MKRIKKFEAFNHREPEEVSEETFNKKAKIHGHESFTQKEINFLNGIYKIEEIYQLSYLDYDVRFISNKNGLVHIQITKLEDDWYLIYEDRNLHKEHDDRYYICDEWDEVIGYFETRTNLLT